MKFHYLHPLFASSFLITPSQSFTFLPNQQQLQQHSRISLFAAPARLEENVEGVLYVNEKCINCQACNIFAPNNFEYSAKHQKYIVTKQPESDLEIERSRAALAACPVAAIRVENSAQRNHRGLDKLSPDDEALAKNLAIDPKQHPFPRELVEEVYFLGHHNDKSFGAVPYLIKTDKVKVMVDVPRYSKSSVRAVKGLCGEDGPDYLFLTHVDDVADHLKWREEFSNLKRIFHERELGENNWLGDKTLEDVEILLEGRSSEDELKAWKLNGEDMELNDDTWKKEEFIILHTPGHSPGSISLFFRNQEGKGVLFTGDTYGYSNRLSRMSGYPRYGDDLKKQAGTLNQILEIPYWDVIAPGHGKYRIYSGEGDDTKEKDMAVAVDDLLNNRRW